MGGQAVGWVVEVHNCDAQVPHPAASGQLHQQPLVVVVMHQELVEEAAHG